MSEPFYLGAYWGPRREPADGCARRLVRCLNGLAGHSEILAAWYLKADRRPPATQSPISRDELELARLLRSGESRRDVDSSSIPELGFSTGLWNGDFERSVGLSTKCGAWSSAVPNSFVLNLPPAEAMIDLYEPETAKAILAAVIDAWEPVWATWTSHSLREAQDVQVGAPVLGWATYLSSRTGIPDDGIPIGVEIEQVGPGVLVTIGESPRQVSESVLLAARSFLAAALEP